MLERTNCDIQRKTSAVQHGFLLIVHEAHIEKKMKNRESFVVKSAVLHKGVSKNYFSCIVIS
jgi:hypothetical protein